MLRPSGMRQITTLRKLPTQAPNGTINISHGQNMGSSYQIPLRSGNCRDVKGIGWCMLRVWRRVIGVGDLAGVLGSNGRRFSTSTPASISLACCAAGWTAADIVYPTAPTTASSRPADSVRFEIYFSDRMHRIARMIYRLS